MSVAARIVAPDCAELSTVSPEILWVNLFKPNVLGRIRYNASWLAKLIVNQKLPILKKRQSIALQRGR